MRRRKTCFNAVGEGGAAMEGDCEGSVTAIAQTLGPLVPNFFTPSGAVALPAQAGGTDTLAFACAKTFIFEILKGE